MYISDVPLDPQDKKITIDMRYRDGLTHLLAHVRAVGRRSGNRDFTTSGLSRGPCCSGTVKGRLGREEWSTGERDLRLCNGATYIPEWPVETRTFELPS